LGTNNAGFKGNRAESPLDPLGFGGVPDTSNRNPLNLIEAHLVALAMVKLRAFSSEPPFFRPP
jgi:hypothetical protein